MSPRKLIGAFALGFLLLLGVGSRYVPGLSQDHWGTWWSLAYAVSVGTALFATFFDRKNFSKKTWDFNAKRGVSYFFFGWVLFPVMIGVDAMFGTDLTLGQMVLGTLALSVLVGIVGTFTENVGV